jgi:hypothetical protein
MNESMVDEFSKTECVRCEKMVPIEGL